MFEFNKQLTIKIIILLACLLSGICFANLYRPSNANTSTYKLALKDFNNKDYANSYYLFSKINTLSQLKPAALYRQAMCAKELQDYKSELRAYEDIIRHFPANKIAQYARYNAGLLLIEANPDKAAKYFKSVAKSDLSEDFQAAASAFVAVLSIKRTNQLNKSNKNALRNYLENYPDGKFAAQFAGVWIKYDTNISEQDYLLIAKAFYYNNLYEECNKTLAKISPKYGWSLKVLNSLAQNKNSQAIAYLQDGVSKYPDFVNAQDYKSTLTKVMAVQSEYYPFLSKLFAISKGYNKQYLWNLKCTYSPAAQKNSCYQSLYKNFPASDDALAALILNNIINKKYDSAKNYSDKFIEEFKNSQYLPMILFWRGKIEHRVSTQKADFYFKRIINEFPDSYYAYRAFCTMNNIQSSIMNINIRNKNVEFPYKNFANNPVLHSLIEIGDYDVLDKYINDEFVKSWIDYQKGNLTTSVYTAQKAMEKLETKPPKNDLRWRLVYPLNYYETAKKYSKIYGNNSELMLAIIREESHFNPNAGSSVGAMGLMQLMPATAQDITKGQINSELLYDPEYNIYLGNLYFQTLRNLLQNYSVSAIAAYNGGIGSVQRWKTNLKYSDTDEFIEQIPYSETREYVKKVLGSYWNYVRIYQ